MEPRPGSSPWKKRLKVDGFQRGSSVTGGTKIPLESEMASALLALLAAFIGGVYVILVRKATAAGHTLDVLMAVISVNVVIFLPLSLLYYPSFGLNVKSLLSFTAAGLVGTFLGRIFQYLGVERVGASRTEPVSRGSLIVSAILAILVLGEPITAGHLIGIVLLVIGILTIGYEMSKEKTEKLGWRPSWNISLPFIAMFFFGLESPFGKIGLSEGTPVLVGLSVKFSIALLAMAGYLFKTNRGSIFPFRRGERKLYFAAGLLASAVHGLRYIALSISRIVVVDPFLSITPLFVLLLSHFLLKELERITALLVFGSIMVVLGTFSMAIFM